MGWSVGYDNKWKRDIGYGVPSICDHPGCGEEINRGLPYICGGEPYGGERGCGLYFCDEHITALGVCKQCAAALPPFEPTPDTVEWVHWKLTDSSWQRWRDENPDEVARLKGEEVENALHWKRNSIRKLGV
jgi:hypothetical protein